MSNPNSDYTAIEVHIQRARLQRSAALGTFIASTLIYAWQRTKSAASWISAKVHVLGTPPSEYTTSLPRHF